MATFRAILLCLLLMALSCCMWMEKVSAQPLRSNCPVSGRKYCAQMKLTCCKPNPASPYNYPRRGCVDLHTNPGYCGSCTYPCKKGQKCVAGKCVPGKLCKFHCVKGYTCCNGQCVNTRNDDDNCGKCGVACRPPPKGEVGIPKHCYNGECVV